MIEIPNQFMGRPIEGAMKRVLDKTPQTPPPAPKANGGQAGNFGDYWQIPVNYRNGIYRVDLKKSLLDNGTSRTQDDWVQYTENAKKKGDFHVGDMPLYFSILSAFSKATGQDADEAKAFLKEQMRARWLMTLTRIRYDSVGSDKAIHNYNTIDEYPGLTSDFIGPDEWIKNSRDVGYLESLLGTRDVQEINRIFQAINGTDTYVFRLNTKPKQVTDCVARFDAISDWADLCCSRGPSITDASLGVRIASAASGSAQT